MDQNNRHIRITVSIVGILLGAAGILNHGIFEILQGNVRTSGFFIEAIGESHRFWIHGTEGAITLVPNYLLTGVLASLVSLAVIVWSIRGMHQANGAAVFVLLMIVLTLVGGGIGHIVLFIPTWLYARTIGKSLTWWRSVLPTNARTFLVILWKPALALTVFSWMVVMELGIFGWFPRQSNPDVVLNITFGFVLLTLLISNIAFISAIAYDIEEDSVHEGGI